jgi:hypothetical protein
LDISLVLVLALGQVLLPLALLSWLSLLAPQSLLQWTLLAIATGTLLLALYVMGLWLIPPRWALWGYALWWAVAVLGVLRRWRLVRVLPVSQVSWIVIGAPLVSTLYVANETRLAWNGRQSPPAQACALQFPFRAGHYLVLNAGSNVRINSHLATRDRPGAAVTTLARNRRWHRFGCDRSLGISCERSTTDGKSALSNL